MKYAVVSDIHANEAALRAVLADAASQGADAVVCLGDVVGYGPSPAEAVALVRKSCAAVVAGNHDDAVSGRGDASEFVDLAGDAASRHREALSDGDIEWLKSLPYVCTFGGATGVHGDLFDPPKFYYVETEDDAAATFRATDAQLVFTGHTHVPTIFLTGASGKVYKTEPQDFTLEDGKRYVVNPGSVGYPREADGKCLSSYVLYDDAAGTVEFRFLPFSVASVMQRGRNPKRIRRGVIAALLAAAAAVAAAVAWFAAPKETVEVTEVTQVADDPEMVVAVKRVAIPPDATGLTLGLTLTKKPKSPPVSVRTVYFGADGRQLYAESATVKSYNKRTIPIPPNAQGAVEAEITVFKVAKDDAPSIAEFTPSVATPAAAR